MSYQQIIEWLLEGDQSIRHQVHRDLLDSPREQIENEQMLMEIKDGWASTLIEEQDKEGTWNGSIDESKWKSTLWVITFLRRIGLSHHVIPFQLGGRVIFEKGQRWDGGYNHSSDPSESKVCISAITLANMSYLKIKNPRREAIFEYLLESQMDDGGWTCSRTRGGKSSVFSTTLIVLEALFEYSKIDKRNLPTIEVAQVKAHEFLFRHDLFKNSKTNKIMSEKFTLFSFPPRLNYNILEVLDYFQRINHRYNERFEQAISILKSKKMNDRWFADTNQEGESWIDFDNEQNQIITLKAMRIIRWWTKISKFKIRV